MTKQQFLARLRSGLSTLPQADIEERIIFYSEMIDDRMEEGLSEEEAVAAIGSVDEIVSQTLADTPITKLVKEKIKPKRELKAWEIVLLVLGSPIWFSLLIAAIAVIFALHIVIWSLMVALWAVEVAFIASFLGCIASGIAVACHGNGLAGAAMIGVGLIFAGLSILLFFGCMGATRGIAWLTKSIAIGIKNMFVGKENA